MLGRHGGELEQRGAAVRVAIGEVAALVVPTGESPDAVVVPLAAIRRIEISRAAEAEPPLGFSLPQD